MKPPPLIGAITGGGGGGAAGMGASQPQTDIRFGTVVRHCPDHLPPTDWHTPGHLPLASSLFQIGPASTSAARAAPCNTATVASTETITRMSSPPR